MREFKKLQWLLQRKHPIKVELCIRLSVLRWLQVCHNVQNRCSALSLAWHKINGFHAKAKNERFTAAGSHSCCWNLKKENLASSFGRRCQKIAQKACHTCSTIIFPHSLICGNVVVIAVVISLTLPIVDIAVDCKINGLVETSFK